MSFKEQLKESGKQEKEKLKAMSGKDRIWYIWEYYKLHMLALACLLFVLSVIGTMIYNKTFTTRLSYVVINNSNADSSFDEFNQGFLESQGFGKKDKIEADGSLRMSQGDIATELEYANAAKLSALVASKDLDLMIADQVNIDHYAQMGAFQDLSKVLPADLWDKLKDKACYAVNENGEKIPCAVDVNGTAFPEETGLSISPCLMGIISNSPRTDTVLAWFAYVYQEQ